MSEDLRERIGRTFGLNAIAPEDLERAIGHVRTEHGVAPEQLDDWFAQSAEHQRDLAGHLTVGESYFLRHPDQLGLLCREVQDVVRQRGHAVVWSAGCSRGEEPFSVAIELYEQAGPSMRQAVTIRASDIDREAIETARRGVYTAWSLRTVPDSLRRRYFEHTAQGHAVRADVRDWVKIEHLSVQEQLARLLPHSIDFILFRNVAIYLSPDAITQIHLGFERVLRPDGVLLQAATDPPPAGGLTRDDAMTGVYRARPPAAAPPPSPPTETSLPSTPSSPAGEKCVARRAFARWRNAPRPPDGDVAGRMADVSRELAQHPRDRNAHLARGQISLHAGDIDSAIVDLRSALYIAPDHCLARYWYSVALGTGGHHGRALQQLRQLQSRLDALAATSVLEDGATTVEDLRDASRELTELLA
jgi:chemotaxis protein methyltransferase CheR